MSLMKRTPSTALRMVSAICACMLAAASVAGIDGAASAEQAGPGESADIRLNEIQAKGTHNSYRLRPENGLAIIPDWNYAHSPLANQLEYEGVRQFELDVNWGRGAWQVSHVPVVDDRSTCTPFKKCLQEIRDWSLANPEHHALMVMVEPKGELDIFNTQNKHLVKLDADIADIFGDDVITPDGVRAGHATLPEAIASDGWPTVGETRGKILFGMLGDDAEIAEYLKGAPVLEGRQMFVLADSETQPYAALFTVDEPRSGAGRIHELVDAGFLVRTRADALPDPASGFPARRDAAIASGAQFVSTDYPVSGRIKASDYAVNLPGGAPSRCNPRTAPPGCVTADVAGVAQADYTYSVSVDIGGARAYTNSGYLTSSSLFVGPSGSGPVGSVTGGGEVSAPESGTPSLKFSYFPLYPGFATLTGAITIIDSGTGTQRYVKAFALTSRRIGTNGVAVSGSFIEFGFPFGLRLATVKWQIEAV